MGNIIQLKDNTGAPVYPAVVNDSLISVGNTDYDGEIISLRKPKCNVTFLGTFSNVGSPQGILYHTNELYQFEASSETDGTVYVHDIDTFEVKRSFTIPNTIDVHFGTCGWLDADNKIFITGGEGYLLKINISDEENIIVERLSIDEGYSCIAFGVDTLNGVCYAANYILGNNSERIGIKIIEIDYTTGHCRTLIEKLPLWHLQSAIFYQGKLYYIDDNTKGTTVAYDICRIIVVDPKFGITSKVTIPNINKEVEGICIVDDKYILFTYKHSGNSKIGVYKVEF